MTFGEALEAVTVAVGPAGGGCHLEVGAWGPGTPDAGKVRWQAWIPRIREHVSAPSPDLLVERVQQRLATTARTVPMAASEVVI